MAGNLSVSADIAVSGMKAQAERLRVISENMANADSVGIRPGEDPYRRQVVTFKNYVDEATGGQGFARPFAVSNEIHAGSSGGQCRGLCGYAKR